MKLTRRSSAQFSLVVLALFGIVVGVLPQDEAAAEEETYKQSVECRFIVQTAGPVESHRATSWFHYGETPAGCSGLNQVSLSGELQGDEKVLDAVLERAEAPVCPEGTEGKGLRGGVEDVDVNSTGQITRREYVVSFSRSCMRSE